MSLASSSSTYLGRVVSGSRAWVICLLLLTGCPPYDGMGFAKVKEPPPSQGRPVQEACSACHAFPPPESLPRARWLKIIPQMATMVVPEGVAPLTGDEIAEAAEWYSMRAPERLPDLPATPPTDEVARGWFKVSSLTPRGLEKRKIPAVAGLTLTRLDSDSGPFDLLVAEMRARTVFQLVTGAKGRTLRPLPGMAMKLNYPVHTSQADVDGDGRDDLLVASLGGMNPGNEARGSVSALLRDARGRLRQVVVAEALGRVCDARAADLDGDGDPDLVVAAFGWRGPGQLVLRERLKGDGLRYATHVLDTRDGYIHVEPVDLDQDGRLDLVALLSQHHEQVVLFRNEGNLRFSRRVLHQAPHPAWGYSGMQRVDLDRDGDPDFLLSNGDALDDSLLKPYHGVAWLENDGKGKFTHHSLAAMPGCERAVAADLDRDGDLDVVAVAFLPQLPASTWRKRDLTSVLWLERTKEGWRPRPLEKHRCVHPTVAVGDVTGDGKPDIAVGNFVWIQPGGITHSPADYLTLFEAR